MKRRYRSYPHHPYWQPGAPARDCRYHAPGRGRSALRRRGSAPPPDAAVAEGVRQQAEIGIDIPSDGEFGKRGWTSYVAERLGGLESIPGAYSTLITGMAGTQHERFKGFYQVYNRIERTVWLPGNEAGTLGPTDVPASTWRCTGPITYTGSDSRPARHRQFHRRTAARPGRRSLPARGGAM